MTLNIWNDEGDAAARPAVINAELRRLAPDLLALQEVLPEQVSTLVVGTDLHAVHQAQTGATVSPRAAETGGTLVASRWPPRIVEALDLRGAGATDLAYLTLAALVPLPGLGEILFVGTATSFRLDAEVERERQALALTDLDARHRTELPTIMAGDFNADPDTASIRYLTGRQSLSGRSGYYHDVWEVAGDGPGHTWSADNPNAATDIEQLVRQPGHRRRIDYIFVAGPYAHPRSYARIRGAAVAFDRPVDGVQASDHYGVVADLDIGWL
ncbi:endonuclease/exonuclease/phosphatase family protein [Nocardia sp. CDC159]|uniref:Endonuclease/exonuclease/phosphatase family protein n=1 Tax=Nocardia pulmonis TaxID=2951408 RepID=A0A9X2E9G8_9NOCA|nr:MULTISPECIES: endonuclease/exonuclease/phosphatase family protein [Nocardia]MCM6776582.1 endonuclease/exonuclease/phosphatase family protein [Nocardia pulmonis]MCM6789006.1 endonuclease/exonuclease/phosphatase family protein [Nocardia sp. CDC159]